MKKEKEKKIRAKLINYINQQLKISKKKNTNFLINSFTLEELEKKNLRCKEFFIVEEPQIYYNIDNNRSIIQNIYIHNNYFTSNIVIYPLSSRIISPNKIRNNNNIYNKLNMTYIEDSTTGKNLNEITNTNKSIKIKNIDSPVDKSRLIKKELWERKMKLAKNEINTNNNFNNNCNSFEKNGNLIEKPEEKKENNKIELEMFKSRQLSTETIATEISRIIKICHNDKSLNSFGISRSNSIIEETEDIKKAKKYAKKLKYFCRTLKNKKPNVKNRLDILKNKINEMLINKNEDMIDEDKLNYRRIKSRKLILKERARYKVSEKFKKVDILNDNENIITLRRNKKLKSERNLKHRINKNSFLLSEDNYNTEQSTNIQNNQYKTIENDSKKNLIIHKSIKNIRKQNKRLTGKKLTEKEKSPKKDLYKDKKKTLLLNMVIKKMKSKFFDENKKGSKLKKKSKNNNGSKIIKEFKEKRISIDTRNIGIRKSLETVFLNTKNLSSSEEFPLVKISKKKISDIVQKEGFNTNNEKELESINHENKRKNLKKKSHKQSNIQKEKNNNKNLNNKNNKKTQRNLNESNFGKKKRKSSTIYDDEKMKKVINNSINLGSLNKKKEKSKKMTMKSDENSYIKTEYYNTIETNDFNLLDEYLYKKKHKKIKNLLK